VDSFARVLEKLLALIILNGEVHGEGRQILSVSVLMHRFNEARYGTYLFVNAILTVIIKDIRGIQEWLMCMKG
jgi:hypothetical protein